MKNLYAHEGCTVARFEDVEAVTLDSSEEELAKLPDFIREQLESGAVKRVVVRAKLLGFGVVS